MPLASDLQTRARIALEDGAVYTLRETQSGITLRLPPWATTARDAAEGVALREAQTQKWCASSLGAEWTLQDVETGQFLGVEKREEGARLIMKHNATAWCVVPEERDIKSVRLVLPIEGYHVGLNAGGFPELVANQPNGVTSGSNRASFSERPFAWRLSEPEYLTIFAESYLAQSTGTIGWVVVLVIGEELIEGRYKKEEYAKRFSALTKDYSTTVKRSRGIMGQGGYLTIYNATQYDWRKTYQHSYQMNDWNFPATIAAFSSVSIYVEFDESVGKDTGDDAGEATFEVVGAPAGQAQFQFAVKFRDLFTRLLEFPVVAAGSNVPVGGTIDLGWRHNGDTVFILGGQPGNWHVLVNAN
ncbi:hypothetical protein ONZ51_g737 [Trametes cubensis]|uniref:Uncharacterized protein n=1 Tax=Trametes cubensis TaxID=1111947 RepID=A0AAD7XDN5_9APHY|nr:hypothetical protein ONZ51_g737 [Trametes cubensis]